jgi:hypothetical protein
VTKRFELSADMVRARASLHTDQTARKVRKATLKLCSRGLQLKNNCTAWIEADQVKCILADIDADRGDCGWR